MISGEISNVDDINAADSHVYMNQNCCMTFIRYEFKRQIRSDSKLFDSCLNIYDQNYLDILLRKLVNGDQEKVFNHLVEPLALGQFA